MEAETPIHTEDLSSAVKELIETYQDHTVSQIDELDELPSPLEFLRFVARNRPFVVRGGAAGWDAVKLWKETYLRETMGEDEAGKLRVALTPYGNADSVIQHDGEPMFVKPYEVLMPFGQALSMIKEQEESDETPKIIAYGQAQNDNAALEYESLLSSLPKDGIRWASMALDSEPEAVNIWLGGSRSVTSLHKDPYENIYVQIVGQKHFVLLPPVEMACVGERQVKAGTYRRVDDRAPRREGKEEGELDVWKTDEGWRDVELEACLDEPAEVIPVASWDPDAPANFAIATISNPPNDNPLTTNPKTSSPHLQPSFQTNTISKATPFSHLARPLRFTLNPGDMLYLPSLWYHKVSQSSGPEGFVMAVNFWYDLDWSGGGWATNQFLRRTGNLVNAMSERAG